MANSVINNGLKGIQAGFAQAAGAADKVSRAFSDPEQDSTTQFLEGSTELHAAKHQVEASAKVVKVGEELDQEILDILA